MRVKGINFITFLGAIEQSYGATTRQRIELATRGDLHNALKFGGIVAGGWYKIRWYRDLWHVIADQLELDETAVRRLSHKATGIGVNIVYRALAKLTSPAVVMNLSSRIFGYYFDGGKLKVLQAEPGEVVAAWSNCHGFDSYVWNHVLGGSLYFLEAARATSVAFNILGGGGDANWLRASATYH